MVCDGDRAGIVTPKCLQTKSRENASASVVLDCTSSFGRTQMHTLSGCVCICWRIFQGNPSCVRVCVFIADVFATTADAAQIA